MRTRADPADSWSQSLPRCMSLGREPHEVAPQRKEGPLPLGTCSTVPQIRAPRASAAHLDGPPISQRDQFNKTKHPDPVDSHATSIYRYSKQEHTGGATVFQPFSLRLPQSVIDRTDSLAPKAARLPDFAALASVTRANLLRLAVVRGLDLLEAEIVARGAE